MLNSNISTFHISTLSVLKIRLKKLLSKPKEIKQQALPLSRQQMAPRKISKTNQVFHFCFFKQGDKTPRNHERTRAESELLAPGSQLVYFNQFQMCMQPQSTSATALEIPAGKPTVGRGQALGTSSPPTSPATPRQCPCAPHLHSTAWYFTQPPPSHSPCGQ